jgi:dethiobiotin synthetase
MLFITGTDTGVGKTFFSVSLLKALRELGLPAVGFKPIETGCEPKCQDAELLSLASGFFLEPVYSFKTPVAPSVASDLEGVKVELERVLKAIQELSKKYFLVVEGAGGIMVPITWEYTFLDMVKELHLPTVVVALNKLGVINHIDNFHCFIGVDN